MPRSRNIACGIGWILSAYAVYVEYKMHTKPEEEEFTALCDIQAIHASCSNVFTLPQGRMLSYFGIVPEGSALDVPNALLGVLHYTFMLLLADYKSVPKALTSLMVTMAFASTIFLAYHLTFVVFELCLVCWSTHVINTFLFFQRFASTAKPKRTPMKVKV